MKKFLSVLLAVALVCSLAVPALAEEDTTDISLTGAAVPTSEVTATEATPSYPDVAGHWAEKSIDRWSTSGIVQGDELGNMNPNKLLTRGEFAEMLVRLLGLKAKAANRFADLQGSEWYADSILKVAQAGIMLGDELGNCNGKRPISRQEAMVMFARAMGLAEDKDPDLSQFSDGADVADWAAGYIAPLAEMGIVNGVVPGEMVAAPKNNINRASILTLLDKAIKAYITEAGEYAVNEPNGFVVVNVPASQVTVSGEAAGVVVTAGSANADVKVKDMTVDTLRVDAAADVTLSGKTTVDELSVNEKANVIIEKDAAVEDLNANAAAQIVNNGDVTNLNTNASGVTFDGNAPEAVNTAVDVEAAKDSDGEEVTAKGEEEQPSTSTTTRPSVKSADVVDAPIVDHNATPIADEDLGEVTVKGTQSGTKDGKPLYKVTVTGKNIMNHDNANGDEGHWVGFGMPAKVNAEGESGTYTYEVDGSVVGSIATRTYEAKGKTYNTVYFTADTEEEFKAAKYTIAVKDGADLVATYEVSFNVTFYKASGVTVSKSLLDPEDEPFFGQFTIATLFPTATQSGYDITLKGEIDPAKLNKNSGENDPTEYTYYGLAVTDKNIKTLHNVSMTPQDFSTSAKWSMAARIYDTAGTKPVKATHVFELLDAAGRVQDTITVTVDATACSIKGMYKASFVGVDGEVVEALYGTSVTAPAAPESTNEVYYTGNWISGQTVVAAGESVALTADATFTAESRTVGAQELKDRPAGLATNYDGEFDYAAAYEVAGVKLTGNNGVYTYTVDANKFLEYAAKADNNLEQLAATVEGNEYYFYGVTVVAPANAEKMVITLDKNIASLDDGDKAETIELTGANKSEHAFAEGVLQYFGAVAAGDPESMYGFDFQEDGSFTRYVKWIGADDTVLAVNKFVLSRVTAPVTPVELTATAYDFSCPQGTTQFITFTLKDGDGKAFYVATSTVKTCWFRAGRVADGEWTRDDGVVLYAGDIDGAFPEMDRNHQLGWTVSRRAAEASTGYYRFIGTDGRVYEVTIEIPQAIANPDSKSWGDTVIEGDVDINEIPNA